MIRTIVTTLLLTGCTIVEGGGISSAIVSCDSATEAAVDSSVDAIADASTDAPGDAMVDASLDAMVEPLWSPAELSPTLWIEPRNGEFTTVYNYTVDAVSDRSATGNNLVNGGGSLSNPKIAWTSPVFKRRVLDFTYGGAPAMATTSAVDLTQPYLVWALVHADRVGVTQYLFRASATTHGLARLSSNGWRMLFGSTGADSLVIPDSGTGVRAVLFWVDPVNKTASGWLNDWSSPAATKDRSGSSTITAPNDTLFIAAVNDGGGSVFDGKMASQGIAPMPLSPTLAQRDALGLYLNAQFGDFITTSITDPADIVGFSGVEPPPEQVVVLGIGQSNRNHNVDAYASTDMPLITGGGGDRYEQEYPITLYEWDQTSADPSPKHYVVNQRNNPATRSFGREVVWAHRGATAGPGVEMYIAKATYGSTSITDDWDPVSTESTAYGDLGYMYWRAEDRLATIAADLRPGARLIVGWTQGETEAFSGASTYEVDQGVLFDHIVTLASTLGLDAPEFYDSMLHADWESGPVVPARPYFSDVQAAKSAVAASRSDTTTIAQPLSIPLQSMEADYIHLTAEGQCLMGEAEADAVAGW